MATPPKFKVFLTAFILLAVLFGIWFLILRGKGKAERQEVSVIPVRVQKVKPQDLQEVLEYVGNIKAQNEVLVYPKVSGKIIQKIKEDGSPIQKGEAMAYVDRDEVGLKFEKAPIESPLTGIVGRVSVDIGSNVSPATAVALVVDMEKMKIDLNIPERYLPKISLGQEAIVKVDAYPEEEFSGKITMISPVVDLETRSAPIEIMLDNPSYRLKSGMFAKVKLILETHKGVLAILKEAIMGKGDNSFVYVIEDHKAVLKQVTLGMRQGPYFEVLDGLKEGEGVVIMGQQRLYEHAAVTVEIGDGNQEGDAR